MGGADRCEIAHFEAVQRAGEVGLLRFGRQGMFQRVCHREMSELPQGKTEVRRRPHGRTTEALQAGATSLGAGQGWRRAAAGVSPIEGTLQKKIQSPGRRGGQARGIYASVLWMPSSDVRTGASCVRLYFPSQGGGGRSCLVGGTKKVQGAGMQFAGLKLSAFPFSNASMLAIDTSHQALQFCVCPEYRLSLKLQFYFCSAALQGWPRAQEPVQENPTTKNSRKMSLVPLKLPGQSASQQSYWSWPQNRRRPQPKR